MINSFENYLKLGKAKKKTSDPEESKALSEKSKERLVYIKEKQIGRKNAKFILEDAYEAVREAAQALMSLKGYKPYSHEATISFVRDFYKSDFNDEEINKFDRFRQLRNDSVYKAVQITEEDAKDSLEFAKRFIGKIESIFKRKK